MSPTQICPLCHEKIQAEAVKCRYCGGRLADGGPVPDVQGVKDGEHLRLLSMFHYVVAAILAFFGCFPIIHVLIGVFIVVNPDAMKDRHGEGPPAFVGWFVIIFASVFILFAWSIAIGLACAGRFLSQRRRHTYCVVAAALSCLWVPFGTILGVFSLIVLVRPSVKALFDAATSPAAPPA